LSSSGESACRFFAAIATAENASNTAPPRTIAP
jgi:hypothetical protein